MLSHYMRSGLTRAGITSNFRCVFRRFMMDTENQRSYEEAVYALNGLQSNAAYIQKARLERSANAHKNLTNTVSHLDSLGVKMEDLNSLNIIHVSGTKGKGSTCAFAESILRHHGFKTGFYSSPHLVMVNERIRINGKPLSKDLFASYFWKVFDTVSHNLIPDERMPSYFQFLTIMAFYVFVKERVDVAVVEVGIGGLYDCTNIVQKPAVTGVTTLGLDHVSILGDTIMKIAEQKAGIFKPGVPAFTVPQVDGAMAVLQKQAQITGCPLNIAPSIDAYDKKSFHVDLGVPGAVQKLNASLALQLCKTWLDKRNSVVEKANMNVLQELNESFVPVANVFSLDSYFLKGLKYCVWPGRFQAVKKGKFTFYLDGAHTAQSMRYCTRWFQESSKKEEDALGRDSVYRILLFNCTGERKAENMLDPLSELNFDLVIFSPNRLTVMKDAASDQSNFTVEPSTEMEQCKTNREIWCHLMRSYHENAVSMSSASTFPTFNSVKQDKYCDPDNTLMFACLRSALDWMDGKLLQDTLLNSLSPEENCLRLHGAVADAKQVHVLVTGSLHLVGNVLGVIDPGMDSVPYISE